MAVFSNAQAVKSGCAQTQPIHRVIQKFSPLQHRCLCPATGLSCLQQEASKTFLATHLKAPSVLQAALVQTSHFLLTKLHPTITGQDVPPPPKIHGPPGGTVFVQNCAYCLVTCQNF